MELRDLYLKYRKCIVRIIVGSESGDLHTGTGFHIGDGLIVTARHVLKQTMMKQTISGEELSEVDRRIDSITREVDGQFLTSGSVFYHPDKNVDLAVIETDFEEQLFSGEATPRPDGRKKSVSIPIGSHLDGWISDQFVLCKVLVMGYPSVPWARSLELITTEGEVNALIQNVRVPHPYFLISSTARGGFSGAPVISDTGFVIGIIVESLFGDGKPEETGFNAAITIEPLVRLLAERGVQPACIDNDIWSKFFKKP